MRMFKWEGSVIKEDDWDKIGVFFILRIYIFYFMILRDYSRFNYKIIMFIIF